MRQGFNDDQNNPRYNFVPHPVSSDTERGIAAVNKIVTRMDLPGTIEICTATAPDASLYGGGTWVRIGNSIIGFTDTDITSDALYQDDTLTTPITAAGGGSNGAYYCQIVANLLGTSGYLLTQMFWTYTFTATSISGAVAGDNLYTPFPATAGDGFYTLEPANGSDIGGAVRLVDSSTGNEYQGVSRAISSGGSWWLTCSFPTANDPIGAGFQFAANDQLKLMFSSRVDLTPV